MAYPVSASGTSTFPGGGGTSEVDVCYVTTRGVFVIESKNYSGWVFGSADRRWWTVTLPGGHKKRLYNPVWQNEGHLRHMGELLGPGVPLIPMVVFSERCELKRVPAEVRGMPVMRRDRMCAYVRKTFRSLPGALTGDEVRSVAETLRDLASVDEQTRANHVADVRRLERPQG